jgi:hypothetical protein
MGWLRSRAERRHEQAAWDGPFGPPPANEHPRFNPMVRTAAELVAGPQVAAPPAEVGHKAPAAAHAA